MTYRGDTAPIGLRDLYESTQRIGEGQPALYKAAIGLGIFTVAAVAAGVRVLNTAVDVLEIRRQL